MTDGGTGIPEVHALLRALAADRDALELDPDRAAATRRRVAGPANVVVLEGDWREVAEGSFGLVFADARPLDWERILALTRAGGFIVKDDLTPGRPIEGDDAREFLLRDPRLAAVELLTTPQTAAIVAVRRAS